jgi:hypothetical protein
MKPQDLVEADVIQKNFGPGHRITKQLTALRRKDPRAFPAGKKGYLANEVTTDEAARLILILSTNPNPFNAYEFDRAFNCIDILDGFLNNLAAILSERGLTLRGQKVNAVFISLDRPYAQILFDGRTEVFGDRHNFAGVEKFSAIPSNILQELAVLIMGPKSRTAQMSKAKI